MEKRPFEKLGKRIATMRKSAGWRNGAAFAEKAGVATASLRDIERGVSEGRIETRQAIADLIGCSVNDFYSSSMPIKIAAEKLTPEILAEIKAANKESLREAIAEARGLPNQFETTGDLEHIKSLIDGLSYDDKIALANYATGSALGDVDLAEPAIDKRKLRR